MSITIALAGNPNSGKTTLFNALTGANQFVGNWPGVTVEKKEGKLKGHKDVTITDLPGVYSLSPYTLEEVVARNYLIEEKPDAILNIIDGSNLERNLFLTTQLVELGIPVVCAINMMDVVVKRGDVINKEQLSKELGCKVVPISALKGTGIKEVIDTVVKVASEKEKIVPQHTFSGEVDHALAHIEDNALSKTPESMKRWYAIKVFERDEKVCDKLNLSKAQKDEVEKIISSVEKEMDDDCESIITNERYLYISSIIKGCIKKSKNSKRTTSDKIDSIVTNRILALPLFAVIMCAVYYIVVTSVGTVATDWANDGLFGDGFYLAGVGRSDYEDEINKYYEANVFTDEVKANVDAAVKADIPGAEEIQGAIEDGDHAAFDEAFEFYGTELEEKEDGKYAITDLVEEATGEDAEMPDNADYGIWVKGVPVYVESFLDKVNCNEWLKGLILDGIVGGVGAVLGFVPQMLLLFLFLAFLESCGYMARVAFIMDRIFRRFGLSGKSFIPILIGTGCGIPGIMASRTIENERDRRMTIMTTTFIPCGAKLPIIALIATALFGGAWWVGPSAYFLGMATIIISGIILKKTKMFAGDPAPFVMELPAYHMPTIGTILRSMWERGWSFIKKAGTIILLASILIWLGKVHGFVDGKFVYDADMELADSILGSISNAVKWVFLPLGFGKGDTGITATIATVMGLVAKEEVVGVFGVLDFEGLGKLAGYSFLAFNLLCAPCFAAIGAIKREMNNAKWTVFAIAYQCGIAYVISLMIYQFGLLFKGEPNVIGLIVAIGLLAVILYLLFRPYKESTKFTKEVKISKKLKTE